MMICFEKIDFYIEQIFVLWWYVYILTFYYILALESWIILNYSNMLLVGPLVMPGAALQTPFWLSYELRPFFFYRVKPICQNGKILNMFQVDFFNLLNWYKSGGDFSGLAGLCLVVEFQRVGSLKLIYL